MIRLVGVLTQGGVPVEIRSFVDTEGEMLIGALISAAKTLCMAMGSGEVHQLAFRDNTLIVFESKSGYTVVALVDKAVSYAESQLKIIAEEIDNSEIADADGTVTDEHKAIIANILDTYIRHEIEIDLEAALSQIWPPLVDALSEDSQFGQSIDDLETQFKSAQLVEGWENLKSHVEHSIDAALNYALQGSFDKACAASIDSKDETELAFAIKMGALSLQMTETSAPPLHELMARTNRLAPDNPFSAVATALIRLFSGEISSREYVEKLGNAIKSFDFVDDNEQLLQSFLFMDVRIGRFPEFAGRLADYFRSTVPIARAYIHSIMDRNEIFEKLYSVSSYDDFKSKIGFYKGRVQGILSQLSSVLDKRMIQNLEQENQERLGLQGSLQLQNYITLLTALSESPVLTVSERKEVLEEILELYWKYLRSLIRLQIPLFAHTVDSVFQSLGVACAEYYRLSTGDEREAHLDYIEEFLTDVSMVVRREWNKPQIRLSILVVTNAIGPILARIGRIPLSEIELLYAAMKQLDTEAVMELRETDPTGYMTNVGNAMLSLTAVIARSRHPHENQTLQVESFKGALEVHQWFVSHGLICRDDIMSISFLAKQTLDLMEREDIERVLKIVVSLNRIAIQDYSEYDYELAMMGTPLLLLLIQGGRILEEPIYSHLAKDLLQRCIGAWRKYGFHQKAENLNMLFEREFSKKK